MIGAGTYYHLPSFTQHTNILKANNMTKEEQELRNYFYNKLREKRILPELKGETKHKFLNEWNTMKQILDINWFKTLNPEFTEGILLDLCLNFAVWGRYNLKEINPNNNQTEDTPTKK